MTAKQDIQHMILNRRNEREFYIYLAEHLDSLRDEIIKLREEK